MATVSNGRPYCETIDKNFLSLIRLFTVNETVDEIIRSFLYSFLIFLFLTHKPMLVSFLYNYRNFLMNISRYFIRARNLIFPALRSWYSFVHLGVFKIIQPIEHCLCCRFVANCCRRSFHSHLYYTRYQLVTDRSVFLSFSLSLLLF